MGRYSDFASSGSVLHAYSILLPISVYDYWYSAGFTPAFPSPASRRRRARRNHQLPINGLQYTAWRTSAATRRLLFRLYTFSAGETPNKPPFCRKVTEDLMLHVDTRLQANRVTYPAYTSPNPLLHSGFVCATLTLKAMVAKRESHTHG